MYSTMRYAVQLGFIYEKGSDIRELVFRENMKPLQYQKARFPRSLHEIEWNWVSIFCGIILY